jgi:hypothetical protein
LDRWSLDEPKVEPVKNGWHALSRPLNIVVWGATEEAARDAFREAVARNREIRARPAPGDGDRFANFC